MEDGAMSDVLAKQMMDNWYDLRNASSYPLSSQWTEGLMRELGDSYFDLDTETTRLSALPQPPYITYSSANTESWFISPATYKRLQWLNHCMRTYPVAPRNLRKCVERSIVKRRQHD